MKVHNKFWSISGASIAAVGLTLLITSSAFSAPPIQVVREDGSAPGIHKIPAPGAPLAGPVGFYPSYFTGFEATDVAGVYLIAPVTACTLPFPSYGAALNFQPGSVDTSLNWGQSTSCATIVSGVNPAGGVGQHFRMSYDPSLPSGTTFDALVLNARIQRNTEATNNTPPQSGIWTIEFDQAMTGIASDYRLISQDRNGGLPRQFQMVFSGINGLVYHSKGGLTADPQFAAIGVDYTVDTAYHHWKIVNDCCSGFLAGTCTTSYYYDGVFKVSHTGAAGNSSFAPGCIAEQMTQFLVLSNNQNGSLLDLDNLSISSVECPHTCGNAIPEVGEGCEPGTSFECNPGHTCFGVGEVGECTCSRNCTFDEPCMLDNGPNGPYTKPFDASGYAVFQYESGTLENVSIDTCGTSPDYETGIAYWGSWTDPADFGVDNDDCCDVVAAGYAGCANSDPTAACYDADDSNLTAYSACACYDLPLAGDSLWGAIIRPSTSPLVVNISKKAECGGGVAGSCCDTNGHDGDGFGCVDTVTEADCSGDYDTWDPIAKCPDIVCDCIPDCDGRECGDDGCDGICTSNSDGSPNDCDDDNVCTDDSCGADGVCVNADNAIDCDDGLFCTVNDVCALGECHGVARVCPQGNGVCDGEEECDEVADICTNPPDLVYPDDLFCNGVETCDPVEGVQDNEDPCDDPGTQVCYEEDDECFDLVIPTVSEWGLVILALLLLTGAKIYFSRRQATA